MSKITDDGRRNEVFPRLTAAAVAIALIAAPAMVGQPSADWMPMGQGLRTLTDAGYSTVYKIDADDGWWKGKAIKIGSFEIQLESGAVTERVRGEGGDKYTDPTEPGVIAMMAPPILSLPRPADRASLGTA